jgi:hypothetical protein
MNKDLRKIAKALRDQGFDTELTKRGHLRVFLDGIWVTTFSGSPSDWRAYRNALAAAKRAGFQWPP